MKSKKIIILILVVLVIIALIFIGQKYLKKEVPLGKKVYKNQTLDFEFSYPEYWGGASDNYFANPISDLTGEYFEIEFIEPDLTVTPGISPDYFSRPQVQAFSQDYEIYETPILFSEHYNQGAALDFCEKFAQKTLAHLGCQAIEVGGRQIAFLFYAYYIEEGMFSSGDELFIEEVAFIPLTHQKFPGLEVIMPITTLENQEYKNTDPDSLKNIAASELEKIKTDPASIYTSKKLNEFEELIKSLCFE